MVCVEVKRTELGGQGWMGLTVTQLCQLTLSPIYLSTSSLFLPDSLQFRFLSSSFSCLIFQVPYSGFDMFEMKQEHVKYALNHAQKSISCLENDERETHTRYLRCNAISIPLTVVAPPVVLVPIVGHCCVNQNW